MRSRFAMRAVLVILTALIFPNVSFSDDLFQIHLRSGSFDPKTQSVPDLGIASLASTTIASQYHIVQFIGPIQTDWRSAIEKSGLEIINYIPNFAYMVRGSNQAINKISRMSFVRWVGPFLPAYKIEPELLQKTGDLEVSIITFPREGISSTLLNVVSLTERARQTSDGRYIFKSKIKSGELLSLAQDESVAWIELYSEPKLYNNVATGIMNIDHVRQDVGLYGKGQIVAVCDTGLDTGDKATIHPDIRGRVAAAFAYGRINDWSDLDGHGTHVTGSVLGSGVQSGSDPAAHIFGDSFAGSAPDATLVFQSVEDSNGYLSGLGYGLPVIFQAAYDAGARIHSNSWGSDVSGRYTVDSFMVDMYCWARKDMLIVFAAGNAGVDADGDGIIDAGSIGAPATAKDCLAVGASESLRSTGGYQLPWGTLWPDNYPVDPIFGDPPSDNAGGMAAFSSRGPTADGRIKPDIVAPGTNIVSCRSGRQPDGWGAYDANYEYMGGTSMATPLVSGSAALVREYYVKKGLKNPSAALLKATLANGAFDMTPGQYGTGSAREMNARPNSVEGWGRVDVASSLCINGARSLAYVDNSTGLATGASVSYAYTITDKTIPLRFTLVWTDAPGSTNVLRQLVNDLDLKVTAPNGAVYLGNGRVDRINNIEGIDIAVPVAGKYTVTVTGYNTPQGPQPFALVVSGGLPTTVISGTIKTSTNAPIAGVKVTAGSYSDTTDTSGKYAIKVSPGNYTMVPTKASWAFTPYSKAISVPSTGLSGVDFTGTADGATISGIVSLNQPSNLESAHPYGGTNTWVVNGVPGASYTSVHFNSIDVENNRDYVQILNSSNQLIEQYTGYVENKTSAMVAGSSLKIRLLVNGTNTTKTGFTTDWVQSYAAGIPVIAQPGGAQALTNSDGTFDLMGLLPITYTVSSSKTGWAFDPSQKTISLQPGQTSIGNIFAGYDANQIKGRITTLSTSLSQQLTESNHPYGDNYNNLWTINGDSRTARMRIHFNIIDTEQYFDIIRILDKNNNVVETYSGSYGERWSAWVPGNVIKIQMQADSSYSDYFGFRADTVEMESSVSNPKSGVAVSALPSKSTATTDSNGYYTLSGLGFGSFGIEPSLKSWSFTPPRKTVSISVGQKISNKDFRAKASGSVSGKVVTARISTAPSFTESPHPYASNYSNTWYIFAPTGASGVRIHFTKIDTEEGYDYVAVCDKSGAIIKTYTGSFNDVWTDWIPGSQVSVVMWSDSVNETSFDGFISDRYEYSMPSNGVAGATVTASPSGITTTTALDGSYSLKLAEGDYAVTVKKTGASFAVASRPVKIYSEANKPGVDFYLAGFAPTNVSINPATTNIAVGSRQTFTCKYSDPDGGFDISNCGLLLNTSLSGINAVNVSYDALTNKLYLKDNSNTTLLGGFAPGSNNTIENSQCILYCADTTTSVSGNERTVNYVIAFKQTMLGKNCMAWMKVFDKSNLIDGWDQIGSNYKISSAAPSNSSITPITSSLSISKKETITTSYADPNGYSNIAKCYVLMNTSLSGVKAVYAIYDAPYNKLYIRNDANTLSIGGYAPGSANVIENSQFKLYCAETTLTGTGTKLTINWKIQLKQPMLGKTCKLWLQVLDKSGLTDPWEAFGNTFNISN